MILKRLTICIALLITTLFACKSDKVKDNVNRTEIDSIAGNADVARYLKSFKGLGQLSDSSKAPSPQHVLAGFKYPDDLSVDLVLSEPQITQPVEISFDHRGRLWVVQYNQYPYPKGLKITSVDNFLRVTHDKVPAPPPNAIKGADKITFFEDTNGDGKYDKSTDAISGLNIATSVAIARGNIWVLNPPYLLAYPDPDGDGIPNGEPVVHLDGFGMQDTHAVANSLTWGPDGWLYGAQGSTTTSTLNSSVTKGLFLQGQAIWRYNPQTHVVERFAEGGGNNPFNIEIDEKGRLFSGSNGTDRGPYYKQGGYYIKSWGKHGPLSNPYAFGYLPNMPLTGDNKRFTQAFIKYEGGSLPARYDGKMIAINPLLNFVQLTRLEATGSSFKNVDENHILETENHWFRPVDVQAGPDGAVYFADWSDSRLSHVDPRDNWDKNSGRVWRLRNKDSLTVLPKFDLNTYSNEQLVKLLSSKNEWFRKQAILLIGDRKNKAVIPLLMPLFKSGDGQAALEALWAINVSGGFDDKIAIEALHHKDPFVRMWAVRLVGDKNDKISNTVSNELSRLASTEAHPEVRSQLASTAKRLPVQKALPIIKNLLKSHNDATDPDIPLQIWWAIESKAESNRDEVVSIFKNKEIWSNDIIQNVVLKRIMQRYIMAGGTENFDAAAELLQLSPSPKLSKLLIDGLQEGLGGRDIVDLSPKLVKELKPYHQLFGDAPLTLALKTGQEGAVEQALEVIKNDKAELGLRLSYIRIMGEIDQPKSVPVLLKIVENSKSSSALKQAALEALPRYNMAEVGDRVIKAYPAFRADFLDRAAALELFASRKEWAREFLKVIAESKRISKDDVSQDIAQRLKLLNDATINKTVDELWPDARLLTSAEKVSRINKISKLVATGTGDQKNGRMLFLSTCARCHKLFNEGGTIGPDLSGYERSNLNSLLINIIDPNADIREGYEMERIVTADGRTLEGKITSRNGGSITIEPALGGRKTTLAAHQVKEMQPRPTSIMPERLLDKMTDQQIRDILSYIMKKD